MVIDCGANVGLFSALAACKKCNVYAFEPTPETIELLQKTQEMYPENITIVQKALSNFEGKSQFEIAETFGSNNLMSRKDSEGRDYIDVEVTTLDKFVEENHIEHVDFIKADIEGAEKSMLEGAKETIKKYAPKLSLCVYHNKFEDVENLYDTIKSINPEYTIRYAWKKLYAWVEK